MILKSNRKIRIRVGAILIEKDKILLIAHKKKDDIYWLLPGGGVKYGESLEQALKRELFEELGITVTLHGIKLICDSVDPEGDKHIINICFICSRINGEYSLGEDRILHNFGFFNSNEIKNLQIFPPIKDEINGILNNNRIDDIYLGARWIKMKD